MRRSRWVIAAGLGLGLMAGAAGCSRPAETSAGSAAAPGVAALRAKAQAGDAGAQNDLGASYESGRGVAPDPVQAAVWYRKAAEQGLPVAQNNIGRLYARGQGVARDYAAARTWFEKATAQGDPDAMNNLARIHGEGDGVRADPVAALAWSYRAQARFKALGRPEPDWGGLNRHGMEGEMTTAQIAEARRSSLEAR